MKVVGVCLGLAFSIFVLSLLLASAAVAFAFRPTLTPAPLTARRRSSSHGTATPQVLLQAAAPAALDTERRKTLLTRQGPHFQLDRLSGAIEFGATANLVTTLEGIDGTKPTDESIEAWLLDGRSLALSIWDPGLIDELGGSMYRLQVMKLQFVTLQLSPWVEVEMKTMLNKQTQQPVFILSSVNFDPNIEVLPGMKINAEDLGIVIEVAGLLKASEDETGVQGAIAFQTSGNLPPPLLILPEAALKAASDAINNTIVKFAIDSFQKGARANYIEFLRKQDEKTEQS